MLSDVTIYIEPDTYEAIQSLPSHERVFEAIIKVVQHRLLTNVYLPRGVYYCSGHMNFVTSREPIGDIDGKLISSVEWFVGAYVAKRVSADYNAFFIVGADPPIRVVEKAQSSFIQMENDAKVTYNEKLLRDPVAALDKIVYGMPINSIPNFKLKLTTSENMVD